MSTKKPVPSRVEGPSELELARAKKLQKELSELQQQMSRLGGKEAQKAGEVLGQVAKLAQELAASGSVNDPETAKRDLKNQAKKVQDLIGRLGPKPKG